MANELALSYGTTGATVYFLLTNAVGQVWNGTTFESPTAANWSTYKLAATEKSTTAIYEANMPGNSTSVPAGLYFAIAYLQLGGSAATTDTVLGTSPPINWDGSAEGSVDLRSIGGSASAMKGVKGMGLATFSGVVSSDATPTQTSFTANTSGSPGLSTAVGFYANPASLVVFTSGNDLPKAIKVTAYAVSGSVGTFTVESMPSAPTSGDTFIILGRTS